MPTDGEVGEDRTVTSDGHHSPSPRPQVVTRQDSLLGRQDSLLGRQDSKLTRQESKRKEAGATPLGEGGGEGRLGQLMESNNIGLKNSGLFGFVHYFTDRPNASSPISGSSSPKPPPVATSPIQVPAPEASPTGRSSQPNSNSPGASPDPELVKNEVFSDGNKSDRSEKSDVQRSDSRLEIQTSSQSSRTYVKSEEYRQLFHLPPEETLVEDFNCALQKKILLQGHMYLFERYVCFYSNIFGYEKKKVIPLKDITCVRKAKTAGVFPNAIEITSWGKKHFFASFLSRDEAYRLIINGWSQHSGYARIFLGSHYSPMSSPPSQGRNSIDSGGLSSSWRSPQGAASIQPEETYTPRTMEEVPNLVAPSAEVRDIATLEGPTEPGDGENSAEGVPDERLSVNESSSISTISVSPLWEPEDLEAPGMPDGYKTLVESEFSVDVEEFFQLFFSDDAVGFFKGFHTKCGDDDFRCTQWAKHRHFGHARDISFRHPINFFLGPKSTYCHESQRFRVYRNNHLVLETSQQMTDIPYGDYFRVEVRWDVERLCGKGSYHCFVRVSLGVNFNKKTVWRGKIEQGTHDESKEAYTTWVHEAQSVLRDIRALAIEAGTAQNTTAPSSDTGENIREMVILDDLVLAEVEQPVGRIQDEHPLVKISSKADGSRGSRIKEGLRNHRWKKKGSALIETLVLTSQKIWVKGYNMDFRANKQLQLVCFILIGIIIVLMQVGIMIALSRPQKVQYVGVDYSGSCFGGSKGDEALVWLEQRARHVKEEILMAETRLQTLHQDLAVLKSHAGHLLSVVVDSQYKPQQTAPK